MDRQVESRSSITARMQRIRPTQIPIGFGRFSIRTYGKPRFRLCVNETSTWPQRTSVNAISPSTSARSSVIADSPLGCLIRQVRTILAVAAVSCGSSRTGCAETPQWFAQALDVVFPSFTRRELKERYNEQTDAGSRHYRLERSRCWIR